MGKHENLLFMLIFTLVCCILLAACSTTDIGSDKQSNINVITAATAINESKTTETTSAAKAQKETKSVKETVPTQPTGPSVQTYAETEGTEYYEDYDEPEQDYEQYDDWEENDNDHDNYEHEHSFYRHGYISPSAHHDGAIVYECDCGESYTEPVPCTGDEPHDVFADYMELIDEYTTTESTPVGERIRHTYVYQCTICGYVEEIFYQDD